MRNEPITKSIFIDNRPIPSEASACGKAILVGEHAVVYGSRAVAIPLRDMRLNLSLEPSKQRAKSPSVTMKTADLQMTQRVADVFVEAAELLGLEKFPVKITGHSCLPIGAGVGSSAALCIGALRSIARSTGISLSTKTLANLGNSLERRFHGNPSGLDTAVVAYESNLLFQRGAELKVLRSPTPTKFVLVDSGVRSSTMVMIRLASPFFVGPGGDKRIAAFDQVSEATSQALEAGDVALIAEGVKKCDFLLNELGVVTNSLRSIIDDCMDLGCLAAKTTGAGGGGVILAVLDPDRTSEIVSKLVMFFGSNRVFPVNL